MQPFIVSDFGEISSNDTMDEFTVNPVGALGPPDIEFLGNKKEKGIYTVELEVAGIVFGAVRKNVLCELYMYVPSPLNVAASPLVIAAVYGRVINNQGEFTARCKLDFPQPAQGNSLQAGYRIVPRFAIHESGGGATLNIGEILITKRPL
jgi:hypothetical protein|tara:strand:- start:593 stop:1042 length:450 start_codon:yes stop_codon:yes gene_type:complete